MRPESTAYGEATPTDPSVDRRGSLARCLLAGRFRRAVGQRQSGDDFAAADARETVRRALASLTPRQRAAIVMTELLGFSSSEAGKVLGIRPGTVRALATQGRAAFRDLLEDPDA